MLRGIVWIALAGCSQEYGLGPVASDVSTAPEEGSRPIRKIVPRGARPPGVEAPMVVPPYHEQQVALGGGAPSTVADILFVVDDSSSMKEVVGRVREGFEALVDSGVFPSDTRVGVMNTLPGDPAQPDRVHPAARRTGWLPLAPGFGELVDFERIDRFRQVAPPQVLGRFAHQGCDPWFVPDARNADGVPCLVAHTQTVLFSMDVEAGLLALGQRLDRRDALFRTGAAVNVVFVSDTHDPGIPGHHPWFAELDRLRPTFAELEEQALARQPLASFRIHAIAPASSCSSEDWTAAGPTYFAAAEASGGEILDLCTADALDYVDLVRRIAMDGAVPQRPVVPIVAGARVTGVLVDARPTAFAMSADRRAVVLPGALPTEETDVRIRYRLASDRIPDTRTPARDTRKK